MRQFKEYAKRFYNLSVIQTPVKLLRALVIGLRQYRIHKDIGHFIICGMRIRCIDDIEKIGITNDKYKCDSHMGKDDEVFVYAPND